MSKAEKTDTYFHYTDDEGAKGIAKDKKIRPSTDPSDMMIGKGVYLTKIRPDKNTKTTILRNNYDSALPSTNLDRVKKYIEVTLPISKVVKAPGTRDVYKYEDENGLDLSKYTYEIKTTK